MKFTFTIEMVPRSYQVLRGDELKSYKTQLQEIIKDHILINPYINPLKDYLPFSGATHIEIEWWLNDISSSRQIYDLNWGDTDNIAKPIIDALQGIVIKNDRQIVRTEISKHSMKSLGVTNERLDSPTFLQTKARHSISSGLDLVLIRIEQRLGSF